MTEGQILAISRAFERPLITALCGMSIFLGYRLFTLGILAAQSGAISIAGWKARLEKVGPGVFFALFGMIGLVSSVMHSFNYDGGERVALGSGETGAANKGPSGSSLASETDDLLRRQVRALNHVIDPEKDGHEIDVEALKATLDRDRPFFEGLRKELLLQKFGPADIEAWNQNRDAFRDGQIKDEGLLRRLSRIEPYMEGVN